MSLFVTSIKSYAESLWEKPIAQRVEIIRLANEIISLKNLFTSSDMELLASLEKCQVISLLKIQTT
jgi:hypothetical protein